MIARSTLLLPLLFAAVATADVIVKKDGKILGLPPEIEDGGESVKVTADNFRRWLEQSRGQIEVDGYAGMEFARPGGKREVVPIADVADYDFSSSPETREDAFNQLGAGNLNQAIAAFQDLLKDPQARAVFKAEAEFQIGMCYIRQGNNRRALEHFSKWSATPSRYTPEVYRILAEIHRNDRQFEEARKWYREIEKLPGLPVNWLYTARLGLAGVDISERKFSEAEAALRQCLSQIGADPKLVDQLAQAQTLLARLALESGATDRYAESKQGLEAVVARPGLSDAAAATAYAALGDVIYAMGDPDEARFPYMRVVLMYSDQGPLVAHSLNNAGRCFVDLAGRAEKNDPAAAKQFLKEGGDLLRLCMAQYRGTQAAKEAAQVFAKVKERYEAAGR